MPTMVQPSSSTRVEPASVVVISYNSAKWLSGVLSAVETYRHSGRIAREVRALVVDNASVDGSAELVAAHYPGVRLVRANRNLGFAGGASTGIQAVETDVVVLVNPDVLVEPGAINSLIVALEEDSTVAIAGGKLLYPDRKVIQHAGGKVTYPLALADHYGYGEVDRGQYEVPRAVDYVTGAFFAVRRSALDQIGLFDEGFFPSYFEETDLCYRARLAGLKVLYVPNAVAIHHESVTTGKDTRRYFHYYHRNRLRFVLKHWTDEQLARDFFPAEAERMQCLGFEEVSALAEAYADNLAVLEGRAMFFANPAGVAPIPTNPLRRRLVRWLAESARSRLDARSTHVAAPQTLPTMLLESVPNWLDAPTKEAGVNQPAPEHGALTVSDLPSPSDAQTESRSSSESASHDGTLSRLRARRRVIEPQFTSAAPLVASALVRLRRGWNWMSTKWYVRPIVEQQNAFNESVVDAISLIEDQAAETRHALNGLGQKLDTWEDLPVQSERAVVGLTRDLALLEARLQRIEDRLDRIDGALRALTDAKGLDSVP